MLFLSKQIHNWREAEHLTLFETELRNRDLCSVQNGITIADV